MSAEWKRAPLPEGHEEEGLVHDGSNGMGRILLAGLAIGGVLAGLHFYRASQKWDEQRAHDEAHRDPRYHGQSASGTIHIRIVEIDVDIGTLGWKHYESLRGGGFFLETNGEHTANLDFGSIQRRDELTTDGLIADLRQHWPEADDSLCEPSDLRGSQTAIYCNDDPKHVWAWVDGGWLIYAVYDYEHPDHQPDFAEIQRIVASAR